MALPLRHFADAVLRGFYEDTRRALQLLEADRVPFLDGVALEVPANAGGLFTITHKLRRVPQGWLVLRTVAPAAATAMPDVFARSGERFDDTAIELYATAAFESLLVWVF